MIGLISDQIKCGLTNQGSTEMRMDQSVISWNADEPIRGQMEGGLINQGFKNGDH